MFLSPPWGGPDYIQEKFDMNQMKPNGFTIYQLAKNITPNVAYCLPKNVNKKQIQEMIGNGVCEFERNYLNGVVKLVTLYFGDLIQIKLRT